MRKVSILIPLHDNHFANQLCLVDAIKNTGVTDFEILIYNNGSSDSRVGKWAKSFVQKFPGSQYFECEIVKRNSVVLNHLLNHANNEYVCILPYPTFLPTNWLFEMVCANEQIMTSGITAIADHDNRGELTSKMTEDENFQIVYQHQNNIVHGPFLFHWSICQKIGGFDPLLNQGYEFDHFCYRVGKIGLFNYYLSDKNAISIAGLTPSCYFETTKEEFAQSISQMNADKKYTVKISEASKNETFARKHIMTVMNKFKSVFKKEFYLELSETWGFEIIGFSQEETVHLNEFCKKYKLQWIVLPGKTIDRAISIQFYDKTK